MKKAATRAAVCAGSVHPLANLSSIWASFTISLFITDMGSSTVEKEVIILGKRYVQDFNTYASLQTSATLLKCPPMQDLWHTLHFQQLWNENYYY